MKRFLLIVLTLIMCVGMISCSKVEGTYTATCDNLQHGVFDVYLDLKANGKFSLYAKHKTMDIMDNIRYNGTYKVDKSNDGSEYDTLILYYTEYNGIDDTVLEEKTKKCKINTKGTKIILTNFFAESKITLKKTV